MHKHPMLLYLDNCTFNRPFDDQNQIRIRIETEAKLYIQDKILNQEVLLAWSYMLDYENNANPYDERKTIVSTWKNIAVKDIDECMDLLRIAKSLQARGIHSKDAIHLGCSIMAGCDFFVTTDDHIIKKMCNFKRILVVSPIQLLELTNI